MHTAPLLIGEREKLLLKALREKAQEQPMDVREVLLLTNSEATLAMHLQKMKDEFSVDIPTCFSVTYSVEYGHPVGVCRHLSMASERKGKAPTPEAVWVVAKELGFVGDLTLCSIWMEDIGEHQVAVNVVQPFDMKKHLQ